MLAVLETFLCIALIASFHSDIPWWAQIPPVVLLLLPLHTKWQPVGIVAASAALTFALWAVITESDRQPQTLVVYAVLAAMVAPRPVSFISACPPLKPTNDKFE